MHFQWTDLVVAAIMLIPVCSPGRGLTREVLSLIAGASPGLLAGQRPQSADRSRRPAIPQRSPPRSRSAPASSVADHHVVDQHQDLRLLDARSAPSPHAGFAYGLVRGLLLVVIAYFFYDLFVPRDKQDEVVRTARFLPIVQSVRNTAVSMLPAQIQERIQNMTSIESGPPSAATQPSPAEPGEEDQGSGYRDTQRNAIDQMIESTQGAPTTAPANPAPAPAPGPTDQPNFGGQEGGN
jgi:membrane protein required for colicin V production